MNESCLLLSYPVPAADVAYLDFIQRKQALRAASRVKNDIKAWIRLGLERNDLIYRIPFIQIYPTDADRRPR